MVIARLIAMALVLLLASCCFLCVHRSALGHYPPSSRLLVSRPATFDNSLALGGEGGDPSADGEPDEGVDRDHDCHELRGARRWLLAPVPALVVSLSHSHDRRL